MKNKLYLECYSGISGDMTAAALLDLGADREKLLKTLRSIPAQGFGINISNVIKSGIRACDFDVILDHRYENHDHDMEYLHGHCGHGEHHHGDEEHHIHGAHPHGNGEHHHGPEAHHAHEAEHSHEGTGHHVHEHRGMKEIKEILQKTEMTHRARETALRIFSILAEAEAKAHNVPIDRVHFHEVGAVDSIADIVSVAVCLDDLDITEVIIPELYEGQGTVRCQHGILPIPVPAVANIVKDNHLDIRITEVKGELVTPTGAAIAAAIRTENRLPEKFQIEKVGIGAGKRQYECPGILRAMLIRDTSHTHDSEPTGTEEKSGEKDAIWKLETNIDDCSGEALGYVMERLFEGGARDAHYTPVFMKKNRPAWLLTVLCTEEKISDLEQIMFQETTTIGIRKCRMERTILKREKRLISTPVGLAEVKVCTLEGREQFYPEYERTAALACENKISYMDAYRIIEAACAARE